MNTNAPHPNRPSRPAWARPGSWTASGVVSVVAWLLTSGPAVAQPNPLTPPTARVNSCTTSGCHADVMSHPFMHGPVAQQQCFDCHTYTSAEQHTFALTKPANQLCLDCHQVTHNDTVIHKPVAQGDCMACHEPHGSEHKAVLKKNPTKGLCLDCHQEDYKSFEFVHGPVAVGACSVCHESHSSTFTGLLTAAPAQLCTDCHEGQTPVGPQIAHQHKPMEEGCTSCHNPHASNAPFQLSAPTTRLCLSCHEGIEKTLETAHTVHGPMNAAGGCIECHNPHFSASEHLQRVSQPDLCLNCHDQKLTTSDGRELRDIKTLLADNPNHHGPIRQGSCTMCHQPHASPENSLLTLAYPPEFYSPYKPEAYQLCFTCHQADLVRDEEGVGLTNFRNGEQNLHWLHVNREKGRTCRACHEVHASTNDFHVREAVPFGSSGWMLEINFKTLPDGGSCAPACHVEKTYARTLPPEEGGSAAPALGVFGVVPGAASPKGTR